MTTQSAKVTIMILLSTIALTAHSQRDSARQVQSGASFAVLWEMQPTDISEFNDLMQQQGFEQFAEPQSHFGVYLSLQLSKIILSMSAASTRDKRNNDQIETSLSATTFQFDIGYDIIKAPQYSIYPFAGVKTNSFSYIRRETIVNPIFATYLSSQITEKQMNFDKTGLNLGIGFTFQNVIQIGMKVGYIVRLGDGKWSVHNGQTDLTDAPKMESSLYAQITVGIGAMGQNSEKLKLRGKQPIFDL